MAATSAPPPPPNPHLAQPFLFYSGVSPEVSEADIVDVLQSCLKLRILRDQGKVEFESLDRAEKAYATCNGQRLSATSSTLILSLTAPPAVDPAPLARPRIVKQLPQDYSASKLFDLARPFGPLASAKLLYAPGGPTGSPPQFRRQAILTYFEEEHAVAAEQGLQFLEVEGQNIAVQVFNDRRAGGRRKSDGVSHIGSPDTTYNFCREAHSTLGSPASSRWASSGAYPTTLSKTNNATVPDPMSRNVSSSSTASRWSHEEDPLVSLPRGPGSHVDRAERASKAEGVDPRNLYVKSLHSALTTADLSTLFAPFGRITSARVMTESTPPHRSKQFGFVSFADEAMAQAAIREMSGKEVLGKRLTVCVFEPKGVRAQRLSAGSCEGDVAEVQGSVNPKLMTPKQEPRRSRLPEDTKTSPVGVASQPPDSCAHRARAVSPLANSAPVSPHQGRTDEERLTAGVETLILDEPKREKVLELFKGLSAKEVKLCLFSEDTLRAKVADALEILAADDETAAPYDGAGSSYIDSFGSIAILATLPAASIVAMLPDLRSRSSLALSAPTDVELAETNAFMDSLEKQQLEPAKIKQKLGERLFKVVKRVASEQGIKGAPRLTIELLDSEDLRALATLMHFPEVLGEKVALIALKSSD